MQKLKKNSTVNFLGFQFQSYVSDTGQVYFRAKDVMKQIWNDTDSQSVSLAMKLKKIPDGNKILACVENNSVQNRFLDPKGFGMLLQELNIRSKGYTQIKNGISVLIADRLEKLALIGGDYNA